MVRATSCSETMSLFVSSNTASSHGEGEGGGGLGDGGGGEGGDGLGGGGEGEGGDGLGGGGEGEVDTAARVNEPCSASLRVDPWLERSPCLL